MGINNIAVLLIVLITMTALAIVSIICIIKTGDAEYVFQLLISAALTLISVVGMKQQFREKAALKEKEEDEKCKK